MRKVLKGICFLLNQQEQPETLEHYQQETALRIYPEADKLQMYPGRLLSFVQGFGQDFAQKAEKVSPSVSKGTMMNNFKSQLPK